MSPSRSPEPPGAGHSLRGSVRNPRRRPRPTDGESLRTAPRRKRSKLSEDAFAPRGSPLDGELAQNDTRETGAAMNGHPRGGRRTASATPSGMSVDNGTPLVDVAVRGGKKGTGTVKRAMKGDGATVVTANRIYSVKLLPSTPRELRKPGVEYRGSILGAAHQHVALAVTRQQAHVWEYTAHTTVSNARVFDVPFPVREGEPLPFGALVPFGGGAGAHTEIGLLLVSAASGKVVFYESMERAASLGLFQERKTGVEGVITGFSSSETVTELTSADHAGFVLTLSSGRIIQLTLRDAQGKARIFTQALRPEPASSRGVFGSIKGLWSGVWKKGVTALRTRPLDQRGQMQAIALTERCELQIWDLDWSGQYEFRSNVGFKETMVDEFKSLETAEMQGRADNLTAMDFVILDPRASTTRGDEAATLGVERPLAILVLLRVGSADNHDFWLADVELAGDTGNIGRMAKLDSYHSYEAIAAAHRPRLLLPQPGHTAMVAFEDAMALASTTSPDASDDPNAQLHEASYAELRPFEDTIYLRSDKDLAVLGACAEETRSGHASSIAFIKGAGLVRVSATDPTGDKEREPISAKSRIEQAVFYGALQDSIIDFSRKGNVSYSPEEVEEAALAISDEILQSTSPFVSDSPPSIEVQLDFRARAFRALVTHVRQNYPALSRSATWQLLWDAEKVAAGQAMWRAFEEQKEAAKAASKKRSATVLDELCASFANQIGLDEAEETSHDDLVRTFFVKRLAKLDFLLSRVRILLQTLHSAQNEPPVKLVRWVAEADELWSRALETAFAFREDNGAAYGIASELLTDGVLDDDTEYAELPEFWTSSPDILKASSKIATLSREFANNFYEREEVPPESDEFIKQITAVANPRLVQICCLIYRERIGWLASRSSPQEQELARRLEANFGAERYDQFRGLASTGQAKEGMALAEKYRDMHTLTELVVMESQYYLEELSDRSLHDEQRVIIARTMEEMTARISRYFEKFGDDWANAFFDQAFSGSRAGHMLNDAQEHWKVPLQRYLRADPSRAKICWINDVAAASDYGHAGRALGETAVDHETKLWAKKVELSMSKLALLADVEDSAEPAAAQPAPTAGLGRQLKLVGVQDRLFLCLQREVLSAIDHDAEVELAMGKFGTQVTREYPSLQRLLEANIDRVLDHQALSVEELIDVLTLMDSRVYDDAAEEPEGNLEGMEFVLALTVLDAAAPDMPHDRFETLLQLIWKRCYVTDDWVTITSNRSKKSATDGDVQTRLRSTAPWRTFYGLHDQAFLSRPDCHVRVLAPSECLSAACRPEDLAYRFPGHEELLDPILHDNKIQDEMLQSFVTDRRLDEWMTDTEADAQAAVEGRAAQEAEVREQEREAAKDLAYADGVNGDQKANGHLVNGELDEVLADGVLDMDVDMA